MFPHLRVGAEAARSRHRWRHRPRPPSRHQQLRQRTVTGSVRGVGARLAGGLAERSVAKPNSLFGHTHACSCKHARAHKHGNYRFIMQGEYKVTVMTK